jgi:hypothetical protein
MAGPQALSRRIGVRIPFLPTSSTGQCELHHTAAYQLVNTFVLVCNLYFLPPVWSAATLSAVCLHTPS